MIHDKRKEDGVWSDNVVDWEREFEDGDVVIGPGHGSFKTMIMVHEIQLDSLHDHVVHRGVFWNEEYAEQFAEWLDNES